MSSGPAVQQQQRPSCEELVARARALRPILRENSGEGELLRRLPDTVSDALTEAGLFRLLTPTRFGGYACDLRTVLKVTETLGEMDGSASWLVSLGSTAAWAVSHMGSPHIQEEIFGPNPDIRLAGSAAPGAAARRVVGGLRINGRWPYVSGAHHADWAFLAATVPDGSNQAIDVGLWCAVPMKQLFLEKTWDTVGMRATGSDTLVADDVFVPDRRTSPINTTADETPREVGEPWKFQLPFATVAIVALVGPLLGLGTAALQCVIDKAPTKRLHNTFISRQSESAGVQIQIAEAAVRLRTAQLHAYDITDTLDCAANTGQLVTYASRAQIRARLGYLAQQVLDAISTLINAHGAGSFATSSHIQRYWRDANTAARHAALQPVVGYEVYGKAMLGIAERISPTV
jgi:3-hydroxy-9,10-secoandrosta-1,3,5(10)-triene-9,17-dione monooxygenase